MKNRLMRFSFILPCMLAVMTLLTGCGNTFHGMKQDIREDTDSSYDRPKTVTVKKTEVIYTSPDQSQSVPSSPPPLETPPQ